MGLLNYIFNLFQNSVLNSLGVERSLLEVIQAGDIDRAKEMMQCRDYEVDKALREYDPEAHEVNRRGEVASRQAEVHQRGRAFLPPWPAYYLESHVGRDRQCLSSLFSIPQRYALQLYHSRGQTPCRSRDGMRQGISYLQGEWPSSSEGKGHRPE